VVAFFAHGANVEPEGATGRAWAAFREMCAQTRPRLIVPEPGFACRLME
jgi:hypothetical protein